MFPKSSHSLTTNKFTAHSLAKIYLNSTVQKQSLQLNPSTHQVGLDTNS